MNTRTKNTGFTLAEIVIALAIVVIISVIAMKAFIGARKSSELSSISDDIVFQLEQARSDALAGKYGLGSGVSFSTTTYTYFDGNTYDPSTTTNKTFTLTNGYEVTTTPTTLTVIFARLTGVPQTMATVTISDTNDVTRNKSILVGSQGDVSVIK